MIDPARAVLIRNHPLDQIINLLEPLTPGNRQLARPPEKLERRLRRMPLPPAARRTAFARLGQLPRQQRPLPQHPLANLVDHRLERRPVPNPPPLPHPHVLALEPQLPVAKIRARNHRRIMRPVLEQCPVVMQQPLEITPPIPIRARQQDHVMRTLDRVDAVDLHIAQTIDQLRQPTPIHPPPQRLAQPIKLEQQQPRLTIGDPYPAQSRLPLCPLTLQANGKPDKDARRMILLCTPPVFGLEGLRRPFSQSRRSPAIPPGATRRPPPAIREYRAARPSESAARDRTSAARRSRQGAPRPSSQATSTSAPGPSSGSSSRTIATPQRWNGDHAVEQTRPTGLPPPCRDQAEPRRRRPARAAPRCAAAVRLLQRRLADEIAPCRDRPWRRARPRKGVTVSSKSDPALSSPASIRRAPPTATGSMPKGSARLEHAIADRLRIDVRRVGRSPSRARW